MPGPLSTWVAYDLSLPAAATGYKEAVVRAAGTVKEVWVGSNVLMTAGNVAVAKGSTNLLAETNVDLAASGGDVAAGVGEAITLATGNAALRVAAGDILKATWTVTTAGNFVAGSCIVWVEPDGI